MAYEEVKQFPELFDAKEAVTRISTEVDILERQMHQPGMYPILQSPVPTTFEFAPHRPTSTFKPINPAVPSPAAGTSQQGSFNSFAGYGELDTEWQPIFRQLDTMWTEITG